MGVATSDYPELPDFTEHGVHAQAAERALADARKARDAAADEHAAAVKRRKAAEADERAAGERLAEAEEAVAAAEADLDG